ncbi:hypothetical protein GWI33_014508 [Rhynchophorus ferrugineus]|uniref:Uncharacterized protein n=1 Tax=Rhynchophorus ferrugineus TaxID=354439 RepID=A0A834I1I0_RHYFE|nr:hypothetical protein GWI33_014508 [Rhynchophorus ferrugineus]
MITQKSMDRRRSRRNDSSTPHISKYTPYNISSFFLPIGHVGFGLVVQTFASSRHQKDVDDGWGPRGERRRRENEAARRGRSSLIKSCLNCRTICQRCGGRGARDALF